MPNLDPLWQWIREREAIRIRKERGDAPPWTTDPILARYRFCNVRREDDRITRWIRTHVRDRFRGHPRLWLMLCICRQINWPDTIADLIRSGAWPDVRDFYPRLMTRVLQDRRASGEKIYTGAYMIPAPSTQGSDKQAHICENVIGALHDRAGAWTDGPIRDGSTLQGVWQWIRESRGWGPFLAYQAVVDMRFCDGLLDRAPDRYTWAAAGPGTIRGLNRVHGRRVDAPLSQVKALDEMRRIYERAQDETGVPMDFSDVPNVLCETDKYLRVALGEGRPRALYVLNRGA